MQTQTVSVLFVKHVCDIYIHELHFYLVQTTKRFTEGECFTSLNALLIFTKRAANVAAMEKRLFAQQTKNFSSRQLEQSVENKETHVSALIGPTDWNTTAMYCIEHLFPACCIS